MYLKSKVLIIAGSDSGGGAGIQADIKTVTALGSYAMTAVTAVTAQNTMSVKKITAIPIDNVKKQITMILDDIGADAVKIGMLQSVGVIKSVHNLLKKYNVKNIVLDPVMIAKNGTKLINNNSIIYLKKLLLPLANLITPNIPEDLQSEIEEFEECSGILPIPHCIGLERYPFVQFNLRA